MSEEETDNDLQEWDLRDAPRLIADEWSRRTWYGKFHVIVWEAVGLTLLLTLISILKAGVYAVERLEASWPSKYKEVEDAE